MATKIYGCGDDLIEVEGDVSDELSSFTEPTEENPIFLDCSDGTRLRVYYGKDDAAIWCIDAVTEGALFQRIEKCDDEDAAVYSDVAYFSDGLTSVEVVELAKAED